MTAEALKQLRKLLDTPIEEQRRQRDIHEALAGVDADVLLGTITGEAVDTSPAELPRETRFSSVGMTDDGVKVTVRNHPASKYMQYNAATVGAVLAESLGVSFTQNAADIGRGNWDIALTDKTLGVVEIKAEVLGREDVQARLARLQSEHIETAVDKKARAPRTRDDE